MSSKLERVIGAEDQFSKLPDDILCDILSLLPSKEAAKTRFLSKRWRRVFLMLQKLIVECIDTNLEESQAVFRFISQWIMSSEELSVNEFRLRSKYFPEESVFFLWLNTLLLRCIKVLELGSNRSCFIVPRLVYFPEEFFRSETLVHLRISGNAFVLKIPGFICYPSLKTLYLRELHVVDESGQFRFADAAYPQLQEFCLYSVRFIVRTSKEYDASFIAKFKDAEPVLTISLETLEKLVVDYDDMRIMDRVDIHTQHLKHFQFTVREDTEFDMEVNFSKCQSLVYADIYQFISGELYIKLLSQINNVRTLRISDHSPQDYNGVAGSFPRFIHLTHLKLRSTVHQSVWFLLQHAPNLEVLDYEMSYRCEDFLSPEDVPQCLSESLKEIRITNYKWYEDDIDYDDESDDEIGDHTQTVEYFLQYGAVLGRLSLRHSKKKTAEWRLSNLNLLRNIVRLSQKCEIVLQEETY